MDYTPDWTRMSTSTGYPVVYCPDHPRAWSTGYVYAHTVVAEQSLGRLLLRSEIVHHENEDKSDYSPGNLKVKTRSKHAKDHHPTWAISTLICAYCEKSFERSNRQLPKAKGYTNTFCSRSCNGKYQRERQMGLH